MAAFDHFKDLVNRGAGPGPSTSETHALWLAWAVVDHVSTLDDNAREGLHVFIDFAANCPDSARDCLRGP